MSALPKVSVLLATNRIDQEFRRALRSVVSQDYKNIEIYVVLNGGAVDKLAVARQEFSDERITFITSLLSYLSFSLSLGLNYCSTELVVRMDADDIARPDRVRKLASFMKDNPEVIICGSWYEINEEDAGGNKQIKLPLTDKKIRRSLYFKNPLAHPTIILRKSYVENVGGYLGKRLGQDYDLWCRLSLNKSIVFANLPMPLLQYGKGASSERGSSEKFSAMAASQIYCFCETLDLRWLIGALVSVFRSLIAKLRSRTDTK